MVAKLLDGKALSNRLQSEVSNAVKASLLDGLRVPGLAVILIGGNHPASALYVKNKRQACLAVGF